METVVQVVRVCLPIVVLVGLGSWLRASGRLDDQAKTFVSWLVYMISLPALIFRAVARQPFADLLDGPIVLSVVGVTVVGLLLGLAISRIGRQTGGRRAFLAWCPFWANVTYLGFPLAERACGPEGLAVAAIVNAFAMPAFVMLGTGALAVAAGAGGIAQRLKVAVLNPVVLAAAAGVVVAGLVALAPETGAAIGGSLPLALIAVGASIDWARLFRAGPLLILASTLKLVVTPALVLASFLLFFPDEPAVNRGVAVLLMGMPAGVASWVVAQQVQVAAEEAADHLVVSTALAVITVPIWLVILL
jgi:predicted permease